MYDGKSAGDDSGNSGSSSLPSENWAHEPEGVHQPPPYSQVASSSQFSNQPMQQQQMWNPQAAQGYPPFPHPGAHQQHAYQHGVYPPQAGVIQGRQESAIRHGIASNVMVIGRTYRRRSCTYRLTRLGITLFLVGVILLIMLGVLVIRPTLNDTRLRSTRCTVISSKYTNKDISCDCGRYCTSHYPCLQIQVSYSAKGKRQTGYLYEDVYADKNKCSVQSCSSYEQSNYDDVRGFHSSYGTVDQSYTCYYNPKTPDEVFKYHSSASSDHMKIMHCILWPLVIMMLSAFMLGVLFCRSKGHCCFKKGGSSVPYQDLEPRA